ncbi:hypothetical protein H0R92_03010 [Treponema sp. OMZ 840]|uniref:hypothetical protein n=1 Tax=Treponema sp. OMZ 840 TaxID=244313 RepID=UPI003D933737
MNTNIVKTAVFVFVCAGTASAGLWLYNKTVKNRELQVQPPAAVQNAEKKSADVSLLQQEPLKPLPPFSARDMSKTAESNPPPAKKSSAGKKSCSESSGCKKSVGQKNVCRTG